MLDIADRAVGVDLIPHFLEIACIQWKSEAVQGKLSKIYQNSCSTLWSCKKPTRWLRNSSLFCPENAKEPALWDGIKQTGENACARANKPIHKSQLKTYSLISSLLSFDVGITRRPMPMHEIQARVRQKASFFLSQAALKRPHLKQAVDSADIQKRQ